METRQIVERFGAWLHVRGWTQVEAARRLRVSAGAVNQVLRGSYKGNTEKIVKAMRRLMDREERRRKAPRRPPFAGTSVSDAVTGILQLAHDEQVLVLVLGPSGVGKTVSAEQYVRAEPDCLLVAAVPGIRLRYLAEQVSAAAGLDWEGSSAHMLDRVAQELRGTGRLVIVDEADYLNEQCLQAMRMLHDACGCGMAMLGTGAMLEKLRARRSSTISQFLGRIAYSRLLDGITRDDADAILRPMELPAESCKSLAAGCESSARRLAYACVAAQRNAGSLRFGPQHVALAYSQLLSP